MSASIVEHRRVLADPAPPAAPARLAAPPAPPRDRPAHGRSAQDRLQQDRLQQDRLSQDRLQQDRLSQDRPAHDRQPCDRLRHDGPAHAAGADELWSAYLCGPTKPLRDRLVLHYRPLVRAVASRVAAGLPAHVEHADLVQSGVFGLIDAVERFDPDRCPRFESYAAQRIRGAIIDELREQDWVPRAVRGRVRELERVQERLESRLRRTATDRELAAELGVAVGELRGLAHRVQLVSVDALVDAGGRIADLLPDASAPDPMAVVQARETVRQLSVAVGQLGERDRLVVRLYYLENRTLADIGRQLGVTESRVCQLHSRLVGRLRGRLAELAAG